MKKTNWKKHIYKIVVVILATFFVGGVGLGAANILSIEGVRELYTPEEPLTPYPDSEGALVTYVNSVIEKALSDEYDPKIEMSRSFSLDEDTIKNSAENDRINAAAYLAEDGIEEKAEEEFETKTADFGESASGFLSEINISESDIESYEIKYDYYKCSMCTSRINTEDYSDKCPECGNAGTLDKRYSDEYEIFINVKPGTASFENNKFPESGDLHNIFAQAGENYYSLNSFKNNVTGAQIYVRVNRLTDEINFLRFETDSAVEADLGFAGEYSYLGDVTVTADTCDRFNYSFTWPGVSLDKKEMTVELRSSEVIKATLTCDDPTAYEVKWTSDNEDILTVDEEGYLKTHKQFGDAVITASYVFKDREYSDSCLVHVGVPAEGVDLSKGKLKMNTGDEFTVVAEFDPKDTTNTVCYWFSEDEKIASVDDNGKVTANSPGKTVIFVVTDDGNYYSSCEVEVKG